MNIKLNLNQLKSLVEEAINEQKSWGETRDDTVKEYNEAKVVMNTVRQKYATIKNSFETYKIGNEPGYTPEKDKVMGDLMRSLMQLRSIISKIIIRDKYNMTKKGK